MDGHRNTRKTFNLPIPESPRSNPSASRRLFNLSNRSATPSSISKEHAKARRNSSRGHGASRPIDSRRMYSRRADSSVLDQADSIPVSDSNSRPRDPDLNDVLARLEGHEQRICVIMSNMHNEMTKAANYMLECISIYLKKVVEVERKKIPMIEKLRKTQRTANDHLQELQGNGTRLL